MQNFQNLKQVPTIKSIDPTIESINPTIESINPTIEANRLTERFLDPHDDREDKKQKKII